MGISWRSRVSYFCFCIMLMAEGSLFAEKKPGHAREKIKGILEYIREHFGEEITIRQAAELCFYSESHFMKYFKQYAGMPFIQYLNDYRLTRAGEYLQNDRGKCDPDRIEMRV